MSRIKYRLFSLGILVVQMIAADPCQMNTEILPSNDIYLEVGQPLQLYCMFCDNCPNSQENNANDLVFYINNTEMPSNLTSVSNMTVASLRLPNLPPSVATAACRVRSQEDETSRQEGKTTDNCRNKVQVFTGFLPQEVNNFKCISENLENLTCTWVEPFNPIPTTYTLWVALIPIGRQTCGAKLENGTQGCYWDMKEEPYYNQALLWYNFTFEGSNKLMENKAFNQISLNHFSLVRPAAPKTLGIVPVNASSVQLKWPIQWQMAIVSLQHRVRYRCFWPLPECDWQVTKSSLSEKGATSMTFSLTGLKFAHTYYEVQVQMRSSEATEEDMWSQPASNTARTLSTYPAAPDAAVMGSFEDIQDNLTARYVYVHWKKIPRHLENGDGFNYTISLSSTEDDGINKPTNLVVVNDTYAKLDILNFCNYLVKIATQNEFGISKTSSAVFIPKKNLAPGKPRLVTMVDWKEAFEVMWTQPDHYQPDSYTVFWWEDNGLHQYQGMINWIHVAGDKLSTNITFPTNKEYRVAVSASSGKGSSGWKLVSCIIPRDGVIQPTALKVITVSSITPYSVDISWILECSNQRGILTGFRIYYCPATADSLPCTGLEKNITTRSDSFSTKVTHLTPFTRYKLALSVITKAGEGSRTRAFFDETKQTAPGDPPRLVTTTNVTNNSFVLTWREPLYINGILKYFHIACNENITVFALNKKRDEYYMEFHGLDSYRDYQLQLSACTVKCSNWSDVHIQKTLVGMPGQIDQPKVIFIDTDKVNMSWKLPKKPGGRLDYFQVKIIIYDNNDTTISYSKVDGPRVTQAEINVPMHPSKDVNKRYGFAIRAVNIGPDSWPLQGAWSEIAQETYFGVQRPAWKMTAGAVIGALLCVLFFSLILIFQNRIIDQFKRHRNIQVTLPPGLLQGAALSSSNSLDSSEKTVGFLDNITSRASVSCESVQGAINPREKLKNKEKCLEEPELDNGPNNGTSMVLDYKAKSPFALYTHLKLSLDMEEKVGNEPHGNSDFEKNVLPPKVNNYCETNRRNNGVKTDIYITTDIPILRPGIYKSPGVVLESRRATDSIYMTSCEENFHMSKLVESPDSLSSDSGSSSAGYDMNPVKVQHQNNSYARIADEGIFAIPEESSNSKAPVANKIGYVSFTAMENNIGIIHRTQKRGHIHVAEAEENNASETVTCDEDTTHTQYSSSEPKTELIEPPQSNEYVTIPAEETFRDPEGSIKSAEYLSIGVAEESRRQPEPGQGICHSFPDAKENITRLKEFTVAEIVPGCEILSKGSGYVSRAKTCVTGTEKQKLNNGYVAVATEEQLITSPVKQTQSNNYVSLAAAEVFVARSEKQTH